MRLMKTRHQMGLFTCIADTYLNVLYLFEVMLTILTKETRLKFLKLCL